MMNPGQAQFAGLGNLVARNASMPDDEFVRSATNFVEKTGVSPIDQLAETYRRVMARKNAMIQQGLQAGAQVRSQPPTVKDEIDLQALSLGIGSQPHQYLASGGLVAFDKGGAAQSEPLSVEDIKALSDDAMGFGVGPEFGFTDPADLTMDQLRVERSNALNVTAYPPDGQELARQGRLIGIVVSPYDSAEVRTEKFQRIRDAIAAAKQRESQPRAEIPTVESDAVQRAFSPTGQAQRVAEGRSLSPPAAAPAARPGAPAARPGAAAAGTTSPAASRPGTPGVDTSTMKAAKEYETQAQENIKGLEGRGRPSSEELELRRALLAAQEAEREPRVEYKEPEGMTARELFQLASFDPTKGQWMGSLAGKAAGVLTAREAKAEEFRKLNREIDTANRRLNTAIAAQRLAYSTNDRQAQQAADQAVMNAKMELRKAMFESAKTERQLVVQEREAGAKERQAEASVTSAAAQKETAGEARKFKKDKELGDAIQEAAKIDNAYMLQNAPNRAEYMRADTAGKAKMIEDARVKYVIERAGMFATEAEIRKQMKAGQGTTTPAAGADPLGIRR